MILLFHGFRDSRVQSFRVSRYQGFMVSGFLGFQGFTVLGTHGFRVSEFLTASGFFRVSQDFPEF